MSFLYGHVFESEKHVLCFAARALNPIPKPGDGPKELLVAMLIACDAKDNPDFWKVESTDVEIALHKLRDEYMAKSEEELRDTLLYEALPFSFPRFWHQESERTQETDFYYGCTYEAKHNLPLDRCVPPPKMKAVIDNDPDVKYLLTPPKSYYIR